MQSIVFLPLMAVMVIAAPGGVVQQFPGSTQPLAVASTNVFRSAAHDSAVIKHDRQGGNFAYSVAEAPAYGVVSPVVSQVTQPIATTYTVQQEQPAVATTFAVQQPVVANTYAVQQQQPAVATYAVQHQQPAVATYAVQQPAVATTYAVQQPASTWTVAAAPAHTSTIVTGSTPIVNEIKRTIPVVAGNVATTYGAYPYASAYTYGSTVVDNSSPIVYSGKTNLVGIETEKQINQIHHTATAVQPLTYTATAVQPSTATVVSGTPVTFSNLHKQQFVSTGTPVWSTVQQPANSIVSSGTQWGSSVVSSPISATTYSVPSASVISTGVTGVNQWGYGYGQPWMTGAINQQIIA